MGRSVAVLRDAESPYRGRNQQANTIRASLPARAPGRQRLIDSLNQLDNPEAGYVVERHFPAVE
jgi:hypothetical protein